MWRDEYVSLLVKGGARDNQSSDREKLSQRRRAAPSHMSSWHRGGVSVAEATGHEGGTQLLFPGSHLIIRCKKETSKLKIGL